MKRLILVVLGIGVVGATVFCLNRPKLSPAPAEPAPERSAAVSATEETPPVKTAVAVPEPARAVSAAPAPSPAPVAAADEAKPVSPDAAAVARALEVVLSPQVDLKQKQATWRQLREAGQLDQAIAELKQRGAGNPTAPEYPLALAEAYLAKIPAATDQNGRGIMALQADQSFDDALKLAPENWEAQFMKAASLSHWPDGLGKGEEVIQRLTALINQQEKQPARPEFVSSYLLLGSQYEKAGNLEYAHAVWQAGATLFPGSAELKGKLAGTK
jgi:tetratricopeptide (TPR) repeat protein